MPRYEFQCQKCGNVQERVFRISRCPKVLGCEVCGEQAKKIISKSSIQCDSAIDVSWIKSAEDAIKPPHEPPWDTRGEMKRCMKKNNLVAAG
jgi:putative FmdB family regulatory protein